MFPITGDLTENIPMEVADIITRNNYITIKPMHQFYEIFS